MANNLMQEFPDIQILKDEPLSKYTNTKTGGPADWLAFPKDVAEVQKWLRRNFNDVYNREGSALEKGDVLTYLIGQ